MANASASPSVRSSAAHHTFISTLKRRQVVEKWCRYDGSIESISVERDSFRKEQPLKGVDHYGHQELALALRQAVIVQSGHSADADAVQCPVGRVIV